MNSNKEIHTPGLKDREKAIRDILIKKAEPLFNTSKADLVRLALNDEADILLNDFDKHPHAFVLACLMDRQIKAEKAWMIPLQIQKRLNGNFSIERLAELSFDDVGLLMKEPDKLHRYVDIMSEVFFEGIKRIVIVYEGDASRIWTGKPSSKEVVDRFRAFYGVGPKIANMAVNILAREFKIPFSNYNSIDISADVHVQRVFERLGLTGSIPSPEDVIEKARDLHPEFPGLIDLPCWEIGRQWCRPSDPQCGECYMKTLCKSSLACGNGC